MRKQIILFITLVAIVYMVLFIANIGFLSFTKFLIGAMIWCIAGIWLALFLLANFCEED